MAGCTAVAAPGHLPIRACARHRGDEADGQQDEPNPED